MPGFVDHAKGARVLLDGRPGTIVRSYDDLGDEPGYDVDLDGGERRWVSHRGSRNRLKDLKGEQMRYGTSHFVSKAAAVRYFREYEGDGAAASVERRLAEGAIHVGEPPVGPGQRLVLVDEGARYAIEESAP